MKTNYNFILSSLKALTEDENDYLANLANGSALLYEYLDDINWVGFYLYKNGELVLGPFQGKPACTRIKIGKGVCGTTAKELKTQIVDDVHKFEGHIACDSASNSEIVIPILKDGNLLGVLDIDSPIFSRFTKEDQENLLNFLEILIKNSDIKEL